MKQIKSDIYRDSTKIVNKLSDILLIFEDETCAKILSISPWISSDKIHRKGVCVKIDIIHNETTREQINLVTKSVIDKLIKRMYKFSYRYHSSELFDRRYQHGWNIQGDARVFFFTKRIL